jgi:small acid-soluble spore protein F (minor alpha/beta-type SASP)
MTRTAAKRIVSPLFLHTTDNPAKKRRLDAMSRRRRGVMSEQFKDELAKDLGFYNTVQQEGWGGIKAKDAGNMVKRAIQLAEQQLAKQTPRR